MIQARPGRKRPQATRPVGPKPRWYVSMCLIFDNYSHNNDVIIIHNYAEVFVRFFGKKNEYAYTCLHCI